MTTLLNKVKKLKDALLGLEMELDILESDLFELTVDLKHLHKAKEGLMYNIDFLKKDGIVAVASEYKKSVEQLKIISGKILKYQALKSKVMSNMKEKIKSKDFHQKSFEEAYKELENDPILLVFKKRKKEDNGQ